MLKVLIEPSLPRSFLEKPPIAPNPNQKALFTHRKSEVFCNIKTISLGVVVVGQGVGRFIENITWVA